MIDTMTRAPQTTPPQQVERTASWDDSTQRLARLEVGSRPVSVGAVQADPRELYRGWSSL